MGLDMYLNKRSYVRNFSFLKPEDRHTITITKGDKKLDTSKIVYIIEEAGYWRKANAIHRWFVENVQEGRDDCKEYYVSHEKLKDLLDRVEKVLAASKMTKGKVVNGYQYKDGKEEPILEEGEYIEDPTVAKDLLPTTEGFFFGSTNYDQYYIEDLELTKKILEAALKDERGEFYYHSSW